MDDFKFESEADEIDTSDDIQVECKKTENVEPRNEVHQIDKNIKCDQCPYSSYTKSALTVHIHRVHGRGFEGEAEEGKKKKSKNFTRADRELARIVL